MRAALRWPLYQEILDTPTWQIVDYVKQVVDAEAPIHIEEITTRLREAAGKARAGRQIREHVLTAINVADRLGTFERRGNFAHSPGQTQYVVRSRAGFSQQSKRIDYIAPEEIMQAAIEILREAVAVEIGGLARPVGNKLGFERVTSEITQHLDSVIGTAVESEKVILSGGKYRLP